MLGRDNHIRGNITKGEMEDERSRARQRLRQRTLGASRSDKTPSANAALASEIIALHSSSDEFVPSSESQRDASDEEAALQSQQSHSSASTKRRGLKRLRRADADSDSGDDDDASGNPSALVAIREPVSQSDEWACTQCTFLNDSEKRACEICLTARAAPKPTHKVSAWLTTAPVISKPKAKAKPNATGSVPVVETIDSSDEGEASDRLHSMTTEKSKPNRPASSSTTLWSESSHAQQIDELCVQKKKVQEVQTWLQQSVPSHVSAPQNGMKRLLFLCGPPGSGKSTTVRHLASAMGLTIKEWDDNASAGKLQYHRYMKDDFHVAHVSAWDDFIDFINRSVNYSALQVASVLPADKRSRKRPSAQSQGASREAVTQGQMILLESWPQNLHGSSQDSTVWDEKLTAAFRQVVNPAANLQYPVVCIFSDVRDKKVDAMQLAKVFSEEVVRSPFTSIINFNPVTAAHMKKALSRTLERLNYTVSLQELMKIVDRSDGDMRHAMNMAQLVHNSQTVAPKKRSDTKTKAKKKSTLISLNACSLGDGESEESSRDPFVSDFHILGKLLHSKNIKLDTAAPSNGCGGAANTTTTTSMLVDFDRILDASVMPLDRVLSLLHSNCTDYFTEIEDLDDALHLMSQSETWLHDAYRTTSSSAAFKLSHDIVRSVVVRSIALTNKHPAPSAFRPITAPRTYETTRRMVSSREESLAQQHELTDGSDSSHPYLCRGDVYAFEIQPFVDVIRQRRDTWSSNSGRFHRGGGGMQSAASDLVVDDEIENSDDGGW